MFSLPCRFIAPIEGIGLIIWWMVETIINNSDWWEITYDSLAVTLVEWAFLLLIMIGLNWWIKPLVIHPPQNPTARKVLGFFFKLTPVARLDFEDDDTSPPEYTPPVSVLLHTRLSVCIHNELWDCILSCTMHQYSVAMSTVYLILLLLKTGSNFGDSVFMVLILAIRTKFTNFNTT